jgi:hypothetical protein
MHGVRKFSVLVAITLGASGVMAGEIANTSVSGTAAIDSATVLLSTACQNVGVAEGRKPPALSRRPRSRAPNR